MRVLGNFSVEGNTSAALDYIVSVLFVERLGIKDLSVTHNVQGFLLVGVPGTQGILILPPFLSGSGGENLLKSNDFRLQIVETDNYIQDITGESIIPVLAKNGMNDVSSRIQVHPEKIEINFDILGSAFYILTRTEEMTNSTRDEHNRFPAYASHAYQNDYLHRPIVDEYVEILWWCMKQLWPRLERKPRKFRMLLSHDVDVPFAEAFSSPERILRSLGGDIVNRERIFQAWQLQRLLGGPLVPFYVLRSPDIRGLVKYGLDILRYHGLFAR